MSLQELHIKALEHQVQDLTRDCYYLLSLLNQAGEIDWDNWPQGQKIKEHLERSKDFFETIEERRIRQNELARLRKRDFTPPTMEERNRAAKAAAEELKQKKIAENFAKEIKRMADEATDKIANDLVNRQAHYPEKKDFANSQDTKSVQNDLVNRKNLKPRKIYWTWPVQYDSNGIETLFEAADEMMNYLGTFHI